MSLPTTGEIKLSQIKSVFGGTNPTYFSKYFTDAISAYTLGVSGIPAIGSSIRISTFRGKSKTSAPSGSLPSVSITASYSLNLNSYLSNATSYSLYSNPNSSASISGTTLTVSHAFRGITYTVGVTGTGIGGSTNFPISVKESLCRDFTGTYTNTYIATNPSVKYASGTLSVNIWTGSGTMFNGTSNFPLTATGPTSFSVPSQNITGSVSQFGGNMTVNWHNGAVWSLY